jgi:hypothetical protein
LDTNRAELFWRAIIVAGHGFFQVLLRRVREAGGVLAYGPHSIENLRPYVDRSRHYDSKQRPASGRENTRKDFT